MPRAPPPPPPRQMSLWIRPRVTRIIEFDLFQKEVPATRGACCDLGGFFLRVVSRGGKKIRNYPSAVPLTKYLITH